MALDFPRITEKLLAAFRDEVEAKGARLAVAVIPPRLEVEDAYWHEALESYPRMRAWDRNTATERIDGLLSALGIPHLILKAPLRTVVESQGTPLYFAEDRHFNIDGHQA